MSLITGIPIRDSIHTDFSTGISGWGGYRTELTGEFTRQGGNVSGRYGEFSKDIQEYNRKINTLSGAWSDTGMFLTPYNAGFRYTGTGDFNKWDTYSLLLDGVNDYVDTSLQPDFINTNATMSFWVNMNDFGGTQCMGCHNNKRFYCGFSDHLAGMGVQDANNLSAGADLSSYVEIGKWHHICLVADGGTATYYVDGVSRDTMSYTQASATNPDTNFFIGATSHSSTVYYMNGKIDEVGIFDSALSAAQVVAIYNGGTPQSLAPYSPTAWWRMGDGILDGFGTHAGAGADLGLVTDEVNPTLGAEALPDPNFNNADDWAITGITGDEVFDVNTTNAGKLTAIAAHDGNLYEGVSRSMTNGQIYLLEIEVDTYTQGNFRGEGDCGTWNVPIGGVGTFKHYFRASGTRFRLLVDGEGGAGATFTATSISLKPVNGNAGLMINMAPADIVADTP